MFKEALGDLVRFNCGDEKFYEVVYGTDMIVSMCVCGYAINYDTERGKESRCDGEGGPIITQHL